MTGAVNASDEAVMPLEVRNSSGERETLAAVVDTGFTGFLTLPRAVVDLLSLPLLGSTPATLADGSTATLEVCEVMVVWHGLSRPVECLVTESAPLMGMSLLRGSELRVETEPGGAVVVRPLR
jgi:clan AA aspartic protease